MRFLASSNRPVSNKSPGIAMKVSRPQFRHIPSEKWGKPAASEFGRSWLGCVEVGEEIIFLDSGGSKADVMSPRNEIAERHNLAVN